MEMDIIQINGGRLLRRDVKTFAAKVDLWIASSDHDNGNKLCLRC